MKSDISDVVLPVRTLRELMNAGADAYGDSPAVIYEKDGALIQLSYIQYRDAVRDLAGRFLKEFGCGKIVALPGTMTTAWTMVFLVILYSGNIAAPMDLSKVDDDTQKNIVKLNPDLIFSECIYGAAGEKLKEIFPEKYRQTVESWFEHAEVSTAKCETESFPIQKPDDTAILIFTSGTTGDNKIVELTHRNLCADTVLGGTYFDSNLPVGTKLLSALPVFHMYGIMASIISLISRGYAMCIGGGAWTLRSDIQKFKPNILVVVPQILYNFGKKLMPAEGTALSAEAMAASLAMAKQFFGGELKCVICGGAPMDTGYTGLLTSIGVYLMNGYGITECSPIVSMNSAAYGKLGAVGMTNIEPELCSIKIDNGEICVKGEIVSPGYWKEPVLNKIAYEDGWFKTGDRGYIDEDGCLFITGRIKNILILPDGNNISMDELEAKICACPAVDSAVVMGSVENETAFIKTMIYLSVENGRTEEENRAAAEDWVAEMNRNNPRYKRIADIQITDKPFQRTALGKIKKYKYETPGRIV